MSRHTIHHRSFPGDLRIIHAKFHPDPCNSKPSVSIYFGENMTYLWVTEITKSRSRHTLHLRSFPGDLKIIHAKFHPDPWNSKHSVSILVKIWPIWGSQRSQKVGHRNSFTSGDFQATFQTNYFFSKIWPFWSLTLKPMTPRVKSKVNKWWHIEIKCQ